MTKQPTLSVREAALYLGVTTQRVFQLITDGELKNVRQNTASNVRLSRKEVEARKLELARTA